MTHYNDIYDPMLDALDEDEQKFRPCAFAFMEQFIDMVDDLDDLAKLESTPARRKLAYLVWAPQQLMI